jgi:hypothetical protein
MVVAAEGRASVMAEALGHHPAPTPAPHPAILDGESAINRPVGEAAGVGCRAELNNTTNESCHARTPGGLAAQPNRLDVLVFSTDAALYHQWWDGFWLGPSLNGWERRGGVIIDVSPISPLAAWRHRRISGDRADGVRFRWGNHQLVGLLGVRSQTLKKVSRSWPDTFS